jgi:hypothetical protein
MPLSPDRYTGREDYSRFGASVAGILESFLRTPPHKRSSLSYARLLDLLSDAADQAGIDLEVGPDSV